MILIGDPGRGIGQVFKSTQRSGVGLLINDAELRILKNIKRENSSVLEIGGGDIRHLRY